MRRTRTEKDALAFELFKIVEQLKPMTIRSLFYRAVSAGLVSKTEKEYKYIVRLTGELRKSRRLPYEWLVDAGRFSRQAGQWESPKNILEAVTRQYRYDFWLDQPEQVEVWVEKDAVVGVVEEVTDKYGVALYSCRGYPSLSMISSAASKWARKKRTRILYFGDHDPSGADIPRSVEDNIRNYVNPLADFDLAVKAITPSQIAEYDLPTRPTKASDSRSANFFGESVELDALSPPDLRALVDDSISALIDKGYWEDSQEKEALHKEKLNDIIDSLVL